MKAVLTITVELNESENPSVSDRDLTRALRYAADHLAESGLLAPDDAKVETWTASVEINGWPDPQDDEGICEECGAMIPETEADVCNRSHLDSCSLHPDNGETQV